MSNIKFGLQLELKGDQVVVKGLDGTRTAVSNLEREVASNTKTSQQATETNRALASSFGSVATQARAFGGILAALGAYQVGRNAIISMGDFEYSIAGVKAVTGATSGELADMTAQAKELGSTTKFSASQAAEGMRFLGMAGFSTNEIMGAMPATLSLAAAAGLELGSAADITSNIMSAFGIEAIRTSEIADALATAAASANTDISQMGEAMKYVGPVAAALKISMQDSAAAIGALSNAGIQGSSAGTGLRRVLSGLANPTKEAADALAAMGISIDDVNPKTHSIIDLVTQLKNANLSAADALTIFGDRGGPAILALTEQIPQLKALTVAINDSEGAAKRMADTLSDNLKGDWQEFLSSVEGVFLAIGDKGALSGLREGVQGATGAVRLLGENLDRVGDTALVLSSVLVGRLASSATAAAGSFLSAQISVIRYETQLASLLGVSRAVASAQVAMAATVSGARAAWALIGGPVGAATLAAAAIYAFQDELGLISAPAKQATSDINKLSASLEGLGESQLEQSIASMTAHLVELQQASADADKKSNSALKNQSWIDRLNPWNDTIDVIKDATTATSAVTDQMERLSVVEQALFRLREKNNAKPDTPESDPSEESAKAAAKALLEKITLTRDENALLRQGYDLEQAKFDAAYAHADDLTRRYMDLQREQKAIVDLYAEEAAMLQAISDANDAALQEQIDKRNALADSVQDFLDTSFNSNAFEAFDELGRSLYGVADALDELADRQDAFNKLKAEEGLTAEQVAKINARQTQNQISAYGDITGAAKGYFDEGSKGYKALQAAEQTFRAFEIAMAGKALAAKLLATQSATAATVASVAPTVAAESTKAAAAGATAVVNQGQGDPYTAFGRMAAMAALVASLGVVIGGAFGGGDNRDIAAERQASQGTGSVLGDAKAQSESILNSLELLSEINDDLLGVNVAMLANLQDIRNSLAGLGGLVVRRAGSLNASGGLQTGTSTASINTTLQSLHGDFTSLSGDTLGYLLNPLGLDSLNEVLDPITDALGGVLDGVFSGVADALFGKTSTKTVDTGVALLGQSIADILEDGIADGFVFSRQKITKKKLFSKKTSYKTYTDELSDELERQFGLVIGDIYDTIFGALTTIYGADSDALARLNSANIEEQKISLKGLSGEEQIEAIEAVFSKIADDLATVALPTLLAFADVGEGAFETLARISTQLSVLNTAADALGISLPSLPDDLLAISDALAEQAGGLEQFAANIASYFDFIFTDAEKLERQAQALSATFGTFGETLPESRDGLAALVAGLDLTTEAGQQAFNAVTANADALADYYEQLEDTASAAYDFDTWLGLEDGMDGLRNALADVGLNIDIVQTAAAQGAEGLQAVFAALSDAQRASLEPFIDALDDLVISVDDLADAAATLRDFARSATGTLQDANQRQTITQADYQAVLAAVAGGDLTRVDELTSLGTTLIDLAATTANNELEYQRVVAGVASAAASVADILDPQTELDIATEQLSVLQDIRAELAGYDKLPGADVGGTSLDEPSAQDTAMLANLRELSEQLSALAAEQRSGHAAIATSTNKVAKLLERWDDGDALAVRETS